jgi:sulfite reductase (NADPH) flavoprotein alpha-component
VHLLVVEVGWTTPGGRTRRGACSHYLSRVAPGERVTVAVVGSEMHLPADAAAPVVMAGLGTGMAPFRAFIQERAARRAAGGAAGPMVLYFGARTRAEEYLYGDELDAHHAAGVIAPAGLRLAFSRDGPTKTYIQHLMRQDARMLWDMLGAPGAGGAFYLCGPTWPEGDVEDAVAAAFCQFGNMDDAAARARIQQLKAEKRYVLEVY